jgi:dihydroorotate dehydrogenase electron transfer subunit
MLAYLHGSNAALRTHLYPSRIHTDGFTSVMLPSPAWHVGAELDLLGPIGRGFSPPPKSKRWVLLAIEISIDRLLPLVDEALERDVALAVYSDGQLPDLPAQVEIAATTENLMEWADYIAMILPHSRLHQIPTTLGLKAEIPPAAQVEILTDIALPCGLGVCSACNFHTRGGWKLACEHGPVYQAKGWLW